MIKTEVIEIDGVQYLHTYSDSGRMIERDSVEYDDAIDPINSGRVYTEGKIKMNNIKFEEGDD